MIRNALQWLISWKFDNDQEPGPLLSWFIRHDEKTRSFYEGLKKLEIRLSRDAGFLLEQSVSDRNVLPLKQICRSIFRSDRQQSARRRRNRIFSTTLALFFLFLFGAGVFFSALSGSHHFAVAEPQTERYITSTVQSDPMIQKELVQLCRYSPNESGPFFTGHPGD